MMLEAGQSEARGLAYIAETKKLFPNKPIRYVMNTHPHSDHTGGLPALVAEGATIITQKNNEAFLEKALNTPRTLLNDTLAKNPKKAKIEAVAEKKVYSDGTRTVEMYHVSPAPHSNGLMIAYIPKEKVLFQGDFSLPAPGQPANDHVKALVPILEKLNLDFDRYINVHTVRGSADQGGALEGGREVAPTSSPPTAAVATAVGRNGLADICVPNRPVRAARRGRGSKYFDANCIDKARGRQRYRHDYVRTAATPSHSFVFSCAMMRVPPCPSATFEPVWAQCQ